MKVVTPTLHDGGVLVTFGADQPEHYYPLPASVDAEGTVMTEWEPSAEDLAALINGGRVRIWLLHTGIPQGRKMIPMSVETIDG